MPKPDKPYQPSNATEGDIFQSAWCADCAKDPYNPDAKRPCKIIFHSMAFNPGDKGYPSELVYKDNRPVCTAFVTPEQQSQIDYMAKKKRWEAAGQMTLL